MASVTLVTEINSPCQGTWGVSICRQAPEYVGAASLHSGRPLLPRVMSARLGFTQKATARMVRVWSPQTQEYHGGLLTSQKASETVITKHIF